MARWLQSSTGDFAMVMSSISSECSDDRREHLQVIKKMYSCDFRILVLKRIKYKNG